VPHGGGTGGGGPIVVRRAWRHSHK
jgi:hypothetical protein